ncbi:MAG: ABC transporter substrate-binding protein [Clostridia bacterium]
MRTVSSIQNSREIDDYQVGIKLSQPCVTLTELLANPAQSAVIMPAEVVEAAGAGNVSEYIGTGSLKYESYTPGESITLTKFEDYQPPVDETGPRIPLMDSGRSNRVFQYMYLLLCAGILGSACGRGDRGI